MIEISKGHYYLLKFKKNWADELDCEGFTVVTGDHYRALETLFNDETIRDEDLSFNFGSNQGFEDRNGFKYLEFWNDLEKIDISSSIFWAAFLNEMFKLPYGIFPEPEYLFENFYENEAVDAYYERMNNGDFKLETRKVFRP